MACFAFYSTKSPGFQPVRYMGLLGGLMYELDTDETRNKAILQRQPFVGILLYLMLLIGFLGPHVQEVIKSLVLMTITLA